MLGRGEVKSKAPSLGRVKAEERQAHLGGGEGGYGEGLKAL